MIVFTTLMIFGCFGFFVPKMYLKRYMLLSAVCISSLYFFFTPLPGYDLTRHYELLHILRRLDLKSVLSGTEKIANRLLRQYTEYSRLYLIYAFLISKLKIDAFLPVITGTIIYASVSSIIMMSAEDFGEEIESWKISFCFFFMLMLTDFRTVSGIRNMLAFSLFAYVLYYDLVRNAGKFWCFLAYFLLANIHTSIYLLIVIRLLTSLGKIVPKWILMVVSFVSQSFLDSIIQFLTRVGDVPLARSLLEKINIYVISGGTQYIMIRGAAHFILILIQMAIFFYVLRNQYLNKKFKHYGDFFLFTILFALGAIRQYDIFVRSYMLIVFMVSPFLLSFLNNAVGEMPNELILSKRSLIGFREVCLYLMCIAAVILSMIMYYRGFYTPMDSGFI